MEKLAEQYLDYLEKRAEHLKEHNKEIPQELKTIIWETYLIVKR